MTEGVMRDVGSLATRLSLILAAAAAAIVLLAPLGTSTTQEAVEPGEPAPPPESTRTTLLSEEGLVLVPLAGFPVALAAIPVVGDRFWPGRRGLRVVAAVSLWLFVVAGLVSIGLYYAPSAAAMTVAAIRRRRGVPRGDGLGPGDGGS